MQKKPVISFINVDKSFHINRDIGIKQRFSKIQNVKQEYIRVLNDISFSIDRGETVGLSGPNGSGKSTILRLIAGIIRPDSGKITVRGKVAPVIELGSGLHPELTGMDNIFLYASILGVEKKHLDNYLKKIVSFSGLAKFIDVPLKKYSSGMKARLAFSVAAFSNADILLMDEVFAVGDLFFRDKSMKLLKRLAKHKTIVFASHDLGLMQYICNRILVIDNCQILNKEKEIQIEFIKSMPINYEFKAEATSNSMYPLIKRGETVSVKKVKFDKLRPGDIIAFYLINMPEIIVHRVIDVINKDGEDICITKGDNSASFDRWEISPFNYLGKVIFQ